MSHGREATHRVGSDTLTLWEALAVTTTAARGAAILAGRGATDSFDSACAAPVAEGAAAAISELRERVGDEVSTLLACPRCAALMEVPLALPALGQVPADTARVVGSAVVRAPTTLDLLAVVGEADPAAALRRRCVAPPDAVDRDPAGVEEIDSAAEELCGPAALAVRATCADCGTTILADVDVVGLAAAQIADDAHALLEDVALLSSSFGWSEAAILALSPTRRATYVALARVRRSR